MKNATKYLIILTLIVAPAAQAEAWLINGCSICQYDGSDPNSYWWFSAWPTPDQSQDFSALNIHGMSGDFLWCWPTTPTAQYSPSNILAGQVSESVLQTFAAILSIADARKSKVNVQVCQFIDDNNSATFEITTMTPQK